jgi:hypothetical protein
MSPEYQQLGKLMRDVIEIWNRAAWFGRAHWASVPNL